MPSDGGGVRACPGGPAINVDVERCVAQCPRCDYTFSTLMDEPDVPAHYVSLNGQVVMFPLYRRCDDPDCPDGFAYRAPFPAVDHYHYAGPSPDAGSL